MCWTCSSRCGTGSAKYWPLLLTIIAGPVGLAAALVIKHWKAVVAFFRDSWDLIKGIFRDGWNWVHDGLARAWGEMGRLTRDVWNAVKTFFVNWWKALIGIFTGAWRILGGRPDPRVAGLRAADPQRVERGQNVLRQLVAGADPDVHRRVVVPW